MRLLSLLLPVLSLAQEPQAVFGTTVVIPSGLRGEIYHLPESTVTLAELDRHQPVGAIYTTTLNVPPQDFSFGFPGLTARFEWFAIDYRGKFWIEKPGLYRFRLISDDGALLYIDGQLVADNDGVHSPMARLGSLRLAGGMHAIRVPYFQGPRHTVALMLDIAGPGEQPRPFSTEEFKPPSDPDHWRFPAHLPDQEADADLPRILPERIAASDERKKSKRRRR